MARLIEKLESADLGEVEEALLHFAYEIESALRTAGAEDGEYTRLDLMRLATPFAVECIKAAKQF